MNKLVTKGNLMSYHQFTTDERIKIENHLELGLKLCQIASKLGVHKSTI